MITEEQYNFLKAIAATGQEGLKVDMSNSRINSMAHYFRWEMKPAYIRKTRPPVWTGGFCYASVVGIVLIAFIVHRRVQRQNFGDFKQLRLLLVGEQRPQLVHQVVFQIHAGISLPANPVSAYFSARRKQIIPYAARCVKKSTLPAHAPRKTREQEAAEVAAKVYAAALDGGEKASESGTPPAGAGIA